MARLLWEQSDSSEGKHRALLQAPATAVRGTRTALGNAGLHRTLHAKGHSGSVRRSLQKEQPEKLPTEGHVIKWAQPQAGTLLGRKDEGSADPCDTLDKP